jgi:hypothetical protein
MLNLRKKQVQFGLCLARLITYASEQGYDLILGELHRTGAEQRWIARDRQLPHASLAVSMHQLKLAIEVDVYKNNKKERQPKDLVDFWKSLSPIAKVTHEDGKLIFLHGLYQKSNWSNETSRNAKRRKRESIPSGQELSSSASK